MPTQSTSTQADAILTAAAPRNEEPTLLDILDHVLNSGVVIQGSLVISLAKVDLVYIGLNVVLTSVETALKHIDRGDSR
jgi:gas vesicle structural protein